MKFLYPKYDPGLPTVLCINSDQFNRDIVMLQHWSTRYNWVAILDTHLTETQAPWMPERLQKQAVYVNESGPDVDAAWAKARARPRPIPLVEPVIKTVLFASMRRWERRSERRRGGGGSEGRKEEGRPGAAR